MTVPAMAGAWHRTWPLQQNSANASLWGQSPDRALRDGCGREVAVSAQRTWPVASAGHAATVVGCRDGLGGMGADCRGRALHLRGRLREPRRPARGAAADG